MKMRNFSRLLQYDIRVPDALVPCERCGCTHCVQTIWPSSLANTVMSSPFGSWDSNSLNMLVAFLGHHQMLQGYLDQVAPGWALYLTGAPTLQDQFNVWLTLGARAIRHHCDSVCSNCGEVDRCGVWYCNTLALGTTSSVFPDDEPMIFHVKYWDRAAFFPLS